jgi:hypothetical protein
MELALAAFDVPLAIENAVTLVKERAARHGIALYVPCLRRESQAC